MLSRFSPFQLFAILWTIAHQAPLSMGFSRQEYWSRLPCPPPGHLPHPGIEPTSLTSPLLAGLFFTTSATCEALRLTYTAIYKTDKQQDATVWHRERHSISCIMEKNIKKMCVWVGACTKQNHFAVYLKLT